MIPHAATGLQAQAPLPLGIPVVGPPFRAVTVLAPRSACGPAPAFPATGEAAVSMSAITRAVDVKIIPAGTALDDQKLQDPSAKGEGLDLRSTF